MPAWNRRCPPSPFQPFEQRPHMLLFFLVLLCFRARACAYTRSLNCMLFNKSTPQFYAIGESFLTRGKAYITPILNVRVWPGMKGGAHSLFVRVVPSGVPSMLPHVRLHCIAVHHARTPAPHAKPSSVPQGQNPALSGGRVRRVGPGQRH